MRFVEKPKDDEAAIPPARAVAEQGSQLRDFTIQEVDLCLGLLAMNGGNITKTVRQVKSEYDINIHPNTLTSWRKEKFPAKYTDIQKTLVDKIDATVADKLSFTAYRSAEIQEDILDMIANRIVDEPDAPMKELAPALRNIAQAGQTNVQLRNLLLEKPTKIVETRTVEAKIKEMEEAGIIIDAEPIEEEDPSSTDD